ncbi:MAG: hypothetical protein U9N83_11340 [Thermodesulfobacteriota bacterium]|nr:hypothetical protein [Thermodesulfobacteriota bacterium]
MIETLAFRARSEIIEFNVRIDHLHLLVMVPTKISISDYAGTERGGLSPGL